MRCWIAVILTRLPLQALQPRWSEPLPIAIIDGAQVIALSRMAAAQGVRIGMRSASVHSIAPQVVLQPRDLLREQQSFDAVALALMQYTPEIAAINHQSLVPACRCLVVIDGYHDVFMKQYRRSASHWRWGWHRRRKGLGCLRIVFYGDVRLSSAPCVAGWIR